MTDSTGKKIGFTSLKGRKVEVDFAGGDVSSDGGVLLLREADRRLGLTCALDKALVETRDPRKIRHTQLSLLRQRIYGLALGYEDLNDHDRLRYDAALRIAVEKPDNHLASSATLCRLENRGTRHSCWQREATWAIHRVLIGQWMASYQEPPQEIVLDFDATDDPIHGDQIGRFFHGYYRNWCFLPLYVFCGQQLLVSYLRRSNRDGARHTWAILALLVKEIRARWPQVRIIFRGDSGFCRHRMLGWCERHHIHYVVGLAKNARLRKLSAPLQTRAEAEYERTLCKVRLFESFQYKAGSWRCKRRVVAKGEHTSQGANPRYIVTNLDQDGQYLYDNIYCARGDMENRIKEVQLELFADRTSCHAWWANQLRLLLSSVAYVLVESMRRLYLAATDLHRAQVGTIRLKLLKIGAVIWTNSRRISFSFSSAYPYQALFRTLCGFLNSS